MSGLTNQEIMIIVNRYIGVSGGYLGDFTYRTHSEFYPEYCNLDRDVYKMDGTTRDKFIEILKKSSISDQAKIIRGVLEKFPLETQIKPSTRTKELFDELTGIAERIEHLSSVPTPELIITTDVVERAIKDAETLLNTTGAVSGVDRIHTALHGYLLAVCDKQGIICDQDDSMTKIFKNIRKNHPAFANIGIRSQDVDRILNSFASVLDALNPIRNIASVAHPNEELIGKDEATLVINVARTLLHYLNSKISS